VESYAISTCHMYQNNNFEKETRERVEPGGMCFLREAADHPLLDYKCNADIVWDMKASNTNIRI
jgi:hypothetical protein